MTPLDALRTLAESRVKPTSDGFRAYVAEPFRAIVGAAEPIIRQRTRDQDAVEDALERVLTHFLHASRHYGPDRMRSEAAATQLVEDYAAAIDIPPRGPAAPTAATEERGTKLLQEVECELASRSGLRKGARRRFVAVIQSIRGERPFNPGLESAAAEEEDDEQDNDVSEQAWHKRYHDAREQILRELVRKRERARAIAFREKTPFDSAAYEAALVLFGTWYFEHEPARRRGRSKRARSLLALAAPR